jgi:hypothetical protein
MAAGAAAVLALGRVLPTGQFGFAAAASLFTAAATVEYGAIRGMGVWAVSSAVSLLLLPGGAAGWLFAAFFGYYPIVKLAAERRRRKAFEWGIKLLSFAAGAAAVFAASRLFGIAMAEMLPGAALPAWAFAAAGVAIFVIFDAGYSKLLAFYTSRLSRRRKG